MKYADVEGEIAEGKEVEEIWKDFRSVKRAKREAEESEGEEEEDLEVRRPPPKRKAAPLDPTPVTLGTVPLTADWRSCLRVTPGKTTIIGGVTRTGKTVLVRAICHENRKLFHEVRVFCPTVNHQDSYNFLDPSLVESDVTEEGISTLLEHYRQINMGKMNLDDKKRLLLILDDTIGELKLKSDMWKSTVSKSRHWGVAIVLVTQRLRDAVPPIIRDQCDRLFITKLEGNDIDELQKISGSALARNKTDFQAWCEKAMKQFQVIVWDKEAGYDEGGKQQQVFKLPEEVVFHQFRLIPKHL